MKDIGYGDNYKYAHSYEGNFEKQEYLPDEIKDTKIYDPGNNTKENSIRKFLKGNWEDKYKY